MNNPTQTGVVSYDSDLVRKQWMREGLIQKASESIFAPYMGNSYDAVVYQVNNTNAAEGHTVVFDFDGNIAGKALKGKESATGKGVQKKKFSDKVVVDRYRMVVDNGDSFDGVNIGDLSINSHADSRSKLADKYIRFKDQALIDAAQGNLGQNPTHVIEFDGSTADKTFDVNGLTRIDTILKTGVGFDLGGVRRPPKPYKTTDGKNLWIMMVDAFAAKKLKTSPNYQSLVYNGDVRGAQNRAFTGVIGKIGNLIIVEVPSFMGDTPDTTVNTRTDNSGWGIEESNIELSGFRLYDDNNKAWVGQPNFDYGAADLWSRSVILGASALQLPMGKMPDYKYESYDFDINSESLLEVWTNVQKTRLLAENEDYVAAKVAGIDFGVIAVDIKL
jgi:hypothetical protein